MLVFLTGGAFLQGCSNQVPIPDKSKDHAPTITISWTTKGGRTSVDSASQTTPIGKEIGVTVPSTLTILSSAKNDGGVKQFHIQTIQGGLVNHDLTVSAQPDAQGLVPNLLAIDGTNAQLNQPGNQPIQLPFNQPLNGALTGAVWQIRADATNFNGQTQSIQVNLQEQDDSLVP